MIVKELIENLKRRVLDGGEISFEEAAVLLEIESDDDLRELFRAAHEITLFFHSNEPGICGLVNAKSYLCAEDCAFCAQSAHFRTEAKRYRLMSAAEVLRAAKNAEALGIPDFCIVTSGAELSDEEFEVVLEMYRRMREETTLNLDGSLGWLSPERVKRLREAGVRRVNNNLQCAREFYPKIVSTHSYQKRTEALEVLREEEMEICAGGILGMGESKEDRLKLAFALKPYRPRCFPVNLLDPRPGTPLEDQPPLEPVEILKTVAVYRFIHPQANIKLAGGREVNLSREEQETAFRGGANGLIMGGYLTRSGNPAEEDFEMLGNVGYRIPEAARKQRDPLEKKA